MYNPYTHPSITYPKEWTPRYTRDNPVINKLNISNIIMNNLSNIFAKLYFS